MKNWIKDRNRFSLSGPPNWWLDRLWEFDPSLVVVPSRQGFYYRLAQRRKLGLPERFVNDLLFQQSDTQMLASYSLVPVTTILATANWSNPFMFQELENRAPWRMGGARRVNRMLEEQDRQDRAEKDKHVDELTTYLSRDAWNLYRKKIGLRTQAWSPKSAPMISIDPRKPRASATIYPSRFVRS